VFLGTADRGFESFTRDLYEAIRSSPSLDVTLFRGGGAPIQGERVLRLIDHRWRSSQVAAGLVGKAPERAEEFGFGLRLASFVLRERPDLVFIPDNAVGHVLYRVRQATGAKFRMLLHNGAPVAPPFYRWNHVHQTAPLHYEAAIAAGEPPSKHTLLPIPTTLPAGKAPGPEDVVALRGRLNLPVNRTLLLSVGALNRWHKRMDYVVTEVASLPTDQRPFLLLLGKTEPETPQIIAEARRLLGPDGFTFRTVRAAEVHDYYRAADVFTLASLKEGFGRAYVEALSHGLPCLVDDNPVTRYVLGDDADFGHLSEPGNLASLLKVRMARPLDPTARADQAERTRERFAWERLTPSYIDMIHRAAATPRGILS
jgi:glycosyltransferase involved in cell wall biosynthesis